MATFLRQSAPGENRDSELHSLHRQRGTQGSSLDLLISSLCKLTLFSNVPEWVSLRILCNHCYIPLTLLHFLENKILGVWKSLTKHWLYVHSLTIKKGKWRFGLFIFTSWHYRMKVKVTQLCLTLCDPMDYTVCGVLQARMLEWVAFPFCRESFQSRDLTQVSCSTGSS